jgi:hypothetical protein
MPGGDVFIRVEAPEEGGDLEDLVGGKVVFEPRVSEERRRPEGGGSKAEPVVLNVREVVRSSGGRSGTRLLDSIVTDGYLEPGTSLDSHLEPPVAESLHTLKPKQAGAEAEAVTLSHVLARVGDDRLRRAMRSMHTEEDVERLAARIAAVLPSSDDPVTEAIGPVFETADLVEWLGITKQALHARAGRRTVVAVKTSDGHTVFPEWQFAADGAVLPGVADALRALAAAGMDDATNAMWFTGASPALDGKSAAQWLTERRDPAAVVRAAKQTAARWRQ